MRKKILGKDLEVSAVGLGCMGMNHAYGAPADKTEIIRKSVEQSLLRLQTDHIDLYYQHRTDPDIAPEEVAGVMSELMQKGKILHWGLSEMSEEYLRRANAVCPVTAIQNRYSMMARWHEKLFPVLEELNIGFVAFSPLANGFLSGKYNAQSDPGMVFNFFSASQQSMRSI